MNNVIYTSGYSNKNIQQIIKIIKSYHVEMVIDIRGIPISNRPRKAFNQKKLQKILTEADIQYHNIILIEPFLQSSSKDWQCKYIKNYPYYTLTSNFQKNLKLLMKFASSYRILLLCAEANPKKCHRFFIANILNLRGFITHNIIRN